MKPKQYADLQFLMLQFFEGSIDEAGFQVLNQALKESDEARQLYFRFLKVCLALKNVRYLNKSAQADLDFESFLGELGRYECLAPALEVEELPEEDPVSLKKHHVEKIPYRLNKYSFYTALTALAAAFLVITTIYFLPPRVSPDPVARILDDKGAQWTQDEKSLNRSVLFKGSLNLTGGNLVIAMYDGTEVSLEAPATVELDNIDRISLLSGQLRATVPPVATGFTVCTPSGSVIDYGTEFSVAVDPAGKTSVEVFKGVVELRDSSNPLLFTMAQKLMEGQKGQIAPDGKITWSEPTRYNNGEIRVRWQCPEEMGLWNTPTYWSGGLVRDPELVAEFRATEAPVNVLVDDRVSGADKILGRRADVGLLSRYPVTIRMDGGQVQFEQLWVGRMGKDPAGTGNWIMSDGELTLKGRDRVMLFIGDKCKGMMEIDGGRIEIYGSAKVGCIEGDQEFMESDGTLVMTGGELTVYGLLEVAASGSTGQVQLSGGRIRSFDLQIEQNGVLQMTGGTMILEGNKTSKIQSLLETGNIRTPGCELSIVYDEQDRHGFGKDKTIIRVSR